MSHRYCVDLITTLASHKPIRASVDQGALGVIFATDLDVSSKKRCLERHFTYLKAHTISNKLVIKVSAQKKEGGGGSYDSYKYVFKFRWFQT